jgi:arginine decarboxylase
MSRDSAIPREDPPAWTTADSAASYRIDAWGQGYFAVGDNGHVVVRPDTTNGREIDLHEVVEGLGQRDIGAPVIIRFSDILAHRLGKIHDAFTTAITENNYRGRYLAVYPIKVNQQRAVVEEIWRYGKPFGFGLEVGSKPELLAVMGLTAEAGERPIICNGFKDDNYIEAVTIAAKLGREIIPVVEKFEELELILRHARDYSVRPQIGVRAKLAATGAGRWRKSSGARSKFGLFVSEILDVVDILGEHEMLDCLQLVHCHPGSQLHDIHRIKDAVTELAHVYAELCAAGANLRYIDVGGGLGVDYDGTSSNEPSSMNYSLQEYAADIVYRVATVCDSHDLPHPTIISESGRAITAYSSVLVFNVLGVANLGEFHNEDLETDEDELPQPVRDLLETWRDVRPGRLLECYHDAVQAFDHAIQMFSLGYLGLRERALAERLFWATCARIRDLTHDLDEPPQELSGLDTLLSDIYFCNFSIFQSLPDSWAIDQLFPIVPIHRLDEKPTRQAVLADITCDSDGKIDAFIDEHGALPTLSLHPYRHGEPYYLAAFLVGAYQETLGDLHNLFGDTHVVHLRLHDEGGWWIEEIVKGDTARELLGYMQYDMDRLVPDLLRDCELAVRQGRLTVAESNALRRFYEIELGGYSYLEGGR